jgi:hypothetical protein
MQLDFNTLGYGMDGVDVTEPQLDGAGEVAGASKDDGASRTRTETHPWHVLLHQQTSTYNPGRN